MPAIKLTAEQTKERFGVAKAIENFPANLTSQEEKHVRVVLEYMEIAYSPTDNKGAPSVAHLCAPGNTFAAPSTFPTAHTAEEYAEAHSHVMSALKDLHIVRFDVVVAKGMWRSRSLPLSLAPTSHDEKLTCGRAENFVSLRYTATGSHIGAEHNGIPPTQRKAQWTAAGNFVIDEKTGFIQHWWKDWDKMQMWKQLGWVKPDNDATEFA
ncbi:uncharacterized protein PHACADRAFT_186179 [Phanerochaete carnosa HHB-10118-sp]|uniref:SnoaL-like domain-containing protein n=1 Tax=Phanerochaete carnosa (strain HHB-10118-sp) TaxID=650164 RepID=K5W3M2_PHACS|nr:uncharacterized protein PHACADRAFT_186179 [Phanerochaete carnosa HHB-10118-sp]EKM53524.1 hypothetical protein PHACADRAFT_186179 [Phanerochaete carnosa HHB-10118-sp]